MPAPEESEAPVTKTTNPTANQGKETNSSVGKPTGDPVEGTASPDAVDKETPAPPAPSSDAKAAPNGKKFDNRTRPGAPKRRQ